MDRLLTMRAFTKVVDAGGFAAAAREMGLSRSVVHKYVVDLERELGTQLLRRSTRQVGPTEAGAAFYERARTLLAELDETFAAIAQLDEAPRGNLRINAPMSFGALHLAPLVGEFMARHPDVHVELVLNDRFVDPLEEGFDVTLRIAEPEVWTSLISRTIAPIHRVLCASPVYLAEHGEPSEPRELRAYRCLHYGYQETGHQWKLRGPTGDVSVAVNCAMWCNNGDSLKQVALRDQGIALLPTFIVGDALQLGSLRTVLNDYRPAELALSALYPRHRYLSAKTRLFVEHLVERFSERPHWDLVS
jgi:DNA-binding transcriptional LysR family regulator